MFTLVCSTLVFGKRLELFKTFYFAFLDGWLLSFHLLQSSPVPGRERVREAAKHQPRHQGTSQQPAAPRAQRAPKQPWGTPCTCQCHGARLRPPTPCKLLMPPGHPRTPSLLGLQAPPASQSPAEAIFLLPCLHLPASCSLRPLSVNLGGGGGAQPAPRTQQSHEPPGHQTTTSFLCGRFNFYLPLPSTARPRFLINSPHTACCAAVFSNSYGVARLVSFSSVKHYVPKTDTAKSRCIALHRVLKASAGNVYISSRESPELGSSRI